MLKLNSISLSFTTCTIILVVVVLIVFILHTNSNTEPFSLSSGGRKVGEGTGGSLISPYGLPHMYDNQEIRPVLDPVGYNEYNQSLPNNRIDPTTFYRYYYLEKYSLSILYIILQELENAYPNELIKKLASNKVYIEQMSHQDNVRVEQLNNNTNMKHDKINMKDNEKWVEVIDQIMKYIYSKYPHIDYPFVYDTTSVYTYDIPFEYENIRLNDETYEYDPNGTEYPLYLIQFDIKKNFHYLLALERSKAPDILTLYIKFAVHPKTGKSIIILARVKQIYDAYVDKYEASNDVDYVQFVDKPELRLNLTDAEIEMIVKERKINKDQATRTQCRRSSPNGIMEEGSVLDVTNQIDCMIEGGIWDAPCVKDSDCPFYQANRNYPNEFGGCDKDSGNCQLPVGMTRVGFRAFTNPEQARMYNCQKGTCGDKTSGKCVQYQIDKTKKGELISPDFMFIGDTPVRKKFADLLMSEGLKWCDY
jgi:hypothetical protein